MTTSGSQMLRTLILFAWILATIVVVSGVFGSGTTLSLYLATGWWLFMSLVLLSWPRIGLEGQKKVNLLILVLLILRWAYSWLFSPPEEAVIALVTCLLYVPLLITTATILFSGNSLTLCISVGALMGVIAMAGTTREALAASYLNDWRIGPLVLGVYCLQAWLLNNWVREREALQARTEQAESLALAANTDAMTGIYNRRAADQLIADCAESGRRCSVIFLDVDHFKLVNDRHGHDVGDSVLTHLASILRQRTRAGDFVARWGGEEFVVILMSVSAEESARIAENLRHHIEHTRKTDLPAVTASLGVAHASTGAELTEAIHRADQALYRAKSGGRNRVEVDRADIEPDGLPAT